MTHTTIQSSQKTKNRILALDGLRGLAVLLVFINHSRLTALEDALPNFLRFLMQTFNQNGKTGVVILFLLSGYLLGKLYATVPSTLAFWQKRYTRIFPPLVAMTLSLALIRHFWSTMNPLYATFTVLAVAWTGGKFWRWLQNSAQREKHGKILLLSFLSLQGLTAMWYTWILPMTPAPVYYQIWSSWLQTLVSFVVNLTMTLPFGIYVGQLDGVYWSLTIEILFYVLYPILILPLFQHFWKNRAKISGLYGVLGFIASSFYLYGIWLASASFLGFHILNIFFMIYFIVGILLAFLQTHLTKQWNKTQEKLQKYNALTTTTALIFLLSTPAIYPLFPQDWHNIVQMIFVFPMGFLLFSALGENSWSRWLQKSWLVWVGTVSYSLYLTHTIAIEIMTKNGAPTTVLGVIFIFIASALITLLLTIGLNSWLEKPYFHKLATSEFVEPKQNWLTQKIQIFTKIWKHKSATIKRPWPQVISLTLATFIIVWVANRPPLPLTAMMSSNRVQVQPEQSTLSSETLSLPIRAQYNHLGMITIDLTRKLDTNGHDSENGIPYLITQVLDENGQQVGHGEHNTIIINDGRNFPIGLAIQPESKGKEYTLQLSIKNPAPGVHFTIGNHGKTLVRTVYFPNKREFIHNPKLFAEFVWNILTAPLNYR